MARTHGLQGTYNSGCRCAACRAAHNLNNGRQRVERAVRLQLDPSLAPHGSASTYTNWMCRCAPCVAAEIARQERYRYRYRGPRVRAKR